MASCAPVSLGREDIDRAAEALASRVPTPLAPLARAAYNLRWSWTPGGADAFSAVDPQRWELCGENPIRLLTEAPPEALGRAGADAGLVQRAQALEESIRADVARPTETTGPATDERPVSFFCAEYGVHASLPVYSGGLGALAGDILKESSDRALPLVAVGLMYHQGYFRQRIDGTGWQQEYWLETDPDRLPAALITTGDGTPLTVSVPINGEDVVAQIWRVDIGRIALYLLDAERPENSHLARWTSSQLYVGDPVTRLSQYVLLGVGGMRALRALDIDPGVVHLNEGHAAFVSLELGDSERTVFTTHTPVPAGNDSYSAAEVVDALAGLDVDADALVRSGRTHPDDEHEPVGVTQLALRTSRAANGVSRRHGEVAREMWQAIWPDRAVEDVPIGHVTNGVHVPTWVGGPMRGLLDRHLGDDWLDRASDPATWDPVDSIPDEELWAVRREQRSALVDYVRDRSAADRLSRGEPRDYGEAAAEAFDPDVLTVGFARRLATYKRLTLLISDPARALGLLTGDRPIQIVLAGKAHPRDDDGKRLIQALFAQRGAPEVGRRVIFLHDYDLDMAARLVRGCRGGVNGPRPPMEASGTSGMKSAVNGGLNLSVLDGWWPEAYDGSNGWALSGEPDADHGAQDARDAAELYRLLEDEVVPEFYGRDESGVPRAWLARVRSSLKTIGPGFCAGRMLADYVEQVYAGAAHAVR